MSEASIVIPVYNRAHLVHRAIDTALAQTIPCEVIVVDHGSTDGIKEVIAGYGDRIKYVRKEIDKGPIAAWQDGLVHASGEFVHITYDDDWIHSTFMERCLGHFDDSVAFVYTRANLHLEDQGSTKVSLLHPPGTNSTDRIIRYLLRSPLTISPGCAVFRTKDARENLLDQVPGGSGRFGPGSGVGEDLLLFLLTAARYPKYVHIPAPLADFLAHSSSITINAMQTGQDEALRDAYGVARDFFISATERPAEAPVSVLIDRLVWWIRGQLSRTWPNEAPGRHGA